MPRPDGYLGNGRETLPGWKRARARLRYAKLKKELGPDHPATRAAFGRMLVHGGDGHPASVPQKRSTSIEAIAWHRESGAQPGYWNRTARSIK
jgi:hypothetical protein